MSADLPRRARLSGRKRFAEIFAARRSASDARLVIYAASSALPGPRLGLVVGRRHGGAVRRNRIKRRIREAFRHLRDRLPTGFDYIVVPREGEVATPGEYAASLSAVCRRAAGRAAR